MADLSSEPLADADYAVLAAFRLQLRRFLHFSETAAAVEGLKPQQHQALLAIKAAGAEGLTVGELAEGLLIRPHSASGLAERLVEAGLLGKAGQADDRRRVRLALTPKAEAALARLSRAHREEIRRMRPLLTALLSELG